jgi:hypothetical protein
MSDNGDMPWYTWAFSGVGAVIVVPVIGWALGLFRRVPRQQVPPTSPAIVDGTAPGTTPAGTGMAATGPPVGPGTATPTVAATVTPVNAPGQNQQSHAGLVDYLVAVPEITDPAFRQLLYAHLPPHVAQQLRIGGPARIELLSLIDTFSHFPQLHPWQAFHDRLAELLPASPAVERLGDQLAGLGYIDRR